MSCCLRGARGEGEGRRGSPLQCNFLEIHCHFCLAILPFQFSKNVSVWSNPSWIPPSALESAPLSSKDVCRQRNQKPSCIIRPLLPDCLMLVCFLSLLLPDLSHYLALVQKHPSPSGHLLGILLVCCLSVLEFLQDSYLDTLQPLPFLPLPRVPFMSPSTGSVINPAKSRTTSGHSILQWEWIVLSSMAFRAFTKQWPLQ